MKLVRRKSDKVVQYIFPDDTLVILNNDGLHTRKFRAVDIFPDTHEIVKGVDAPALFVGNAVAWDGSWSVADQTAFDAAEDAETDRTRIEAKAALVEWVDSFLDFLIAKYPARERDSWPVKAQAAEAILNSLTPNAVGDQLLTEEAALVGATKAEIAQVVHDKAMLLARVVGITAGLRQIVTAQIDAATYDQIPAILETAKAQAQAKAQELGIA